MQIKHKKLLERLKPVIVLLVFFIGITIIRPSFMSQANLMNVLRQAFVNAVIAAGMTFVILTGGIDLSAGSVLAFSSAICASMLVSGYSLQICLLVALGLGGLSDLFNGLIITKGKVQPFIATLATMTLLRGATMVFTQGKPISIASLTNIQGFRHIGAGVIKGLPIPVILMVVVFIICGRVLNDSPFEWHIFAVGRE